MTTFDFNTFLQCLEATLQNLNALIECAKDMANGGDINTFNVSSVKSKEMKEETKESTPCTPLKKEKKESKENLALKCSINKNRGASLFSKPMAERQAAFQELIRTFVPKYGSEMCYEFFAYWTEPNKSGTKMRFELEKTWDTARRLAFWDRNTKQRGPRRSTTPAQDAAAAERRETERCENEQRRERDRAEACPLWLVNIGRKYGLLADNPTTASLLKAVSELHRAKRLTDEEARIYEDKTNR